MAKSKTESKTATKSRDVATVSAPAAPPTTIQSKSDMVLSIGQTLTQLDAQLSSVPPDTADWQKMFAMRKHLDDQQRDLMKKIIADDNADFQLYSASIAHATDLLKKQIAEMKKVDDIINTVSQISSNLDSVLKLV